MGNQTILTVFGTRPEAIKMAPLVKALEASDKLKSVVLVTGQHREMLDQVLSVFGIRPDYDLDIMKKDQTLPDITSAVLRGVDQVLAEVSPGVVLVHGDTTTAFASALAAFYRQIPVGHVEAGLRTRNLYSPYPEEMNRSLIGRVAVHHFAPTEHNADALRRENVYGEIDVTGNTVIDALRYTVFDDYTFRNESLQALDLSGRYRTILLTAHRRENIGRRMENICGAVCDIVRAHEDVQIVCPVHPNPKVRASIVEALGQEERVTLVEPLFVTDLHNLMARSYIVLTDSGGLQEEAPALGKPVVVLRDTTERQEAIDAGTVVMGGVERADIVRWAETLLTDDESYQRMAKAANPYGDGKASARIVAHLEKVFGAIEEEGNNA